MKIIVTQEDIDKGRRGDNRNCAVAQALIRRGFRDVTVGIFSFSLRDDTEERKYYRTPMKMKELIRNYDSYQTVEPAEFIARKI